jgi:hypothetical protein
MNNVNENYENAVLAMRDWGAGTRILMVCSTFFNTDWFIALFI